MKNLKLILAFCLFIVLAACSDDDKSSNPNTPDTGKQIVPLAVGNEWTYTKYFVNSQEEYTVKCKKTALMDTTNCFYMENTEDVDLPEYYYISSLGLNVREAGGDKFTNFFKYPCSVGNTYIAGEMNETVKVISINDTVKVPAGTFACVKYSFEYEQTNLGSYYHTLTVYHVCPGVGVVLKEFSKSEEAGQELEMQYQAKLKKYTLK